MQYIVKQTWNAYVVLNTRTGLAQSSWTDSRTALKVARDLNSAVKE